MSSWWFKRKLKEEKKIDFEQNLKGFIEENKHEFDKFCLHNNKIYIYENAFLEDDEIYLSVWMQGMSNRLVKKIPLCVLELQYGKNFIKKQRINFIEMVDGLESNNYKIVKNE